MTDIADVVEELERISEELADMAIVRLSEASSAAGAGVAPDPGSLEEQRRISRARRAVDKAAGILRAGEQADDDFG